MKQMNQTNQMNKKKVIVLKDRLVHSLDYVKDRWHHHGVYNPHKSHRSYSLDWHKIWLIIG